MYIWQEEQFHSQGIDIYTDVRSGENVNVYWNEEKYLYLNGQTGQVQENIDSNFNGFKLTRGVINGETIDVYAIQYTNGYAGFEMKFSTFTYTGTTMKVISKIKLGDETYKISDNNKVDTTSELVANTRFDGQWEEKILELTTSTSSTTLNFDLTEYLPKDGHNYEILIESYWNVHGSTAQSCYYSTDIITNEIHGGIGSSNGYYSVNTIILPVGAGRRLTRKAGGAAYASRVKLYGFRRIGTNE